MSASWQWAKANPDAAARMIRNLEHENDTLREMLRVCANNANDSGEEDSMEDQINELLRKEEQP